MKDVLIKVGIKTRGMPVLKKEGNLWLLKNMLIGDGFHWEDTISVILPGEVEIINKVNEVASEEAKRSSREDNVTLINILPLERYLECVIGSEMNATSPIEFLKAHAVISRSWAMGKISGEHHEGSNGAVNTTEMLVGWDDTSGHRKFHACSDDHCQRYQGLQKISDVALKAIQNTAGEILEGKDGKLIDARFSKCCGGRTEIFSTCWQDENVYSLESFEDPWCDLSDLEEEKRNLLLKSVLKDYDLQTEGYGFRWKSEISKEEIERNLKNKFGRTIGKIKRIEAIHKGPSGRIDLLRVHGTESKLDLGKELWIRRLLSDTHLYSSAFDIEDMGKYIRLTGRGWGHGVGLCQIGASRMAFTGCNYQDILSFYYPGSKLRHLSK